jgi:glutamate 5-kinase
MSKELLTKANRIVIKVGSSSLTGSAGTALDTSAVTRLVDVVAELKEAKKEVVIVTSAAISAGMAPLGLVARPTDLATQQAAASVGQGLLIAKYTEQFNRYQIVASQVLLTGDEVEESSKRENAQRTLFRLLELGVVPIINENDSVVTEEIRMGDNDRLAALVSQLISADLLVLVSDVDALYDAPPSQPGANRVTTVSSLSDLSTFNIGGVGASGVGSGGMVTKIQAAEIATENGTTMLLTNLANLQGALAGADVGTLFLARTDR